MKSSFPKLRAKPKFVVAMAMPSSDILFWKRTVHAYVHICTCMHM